MLTQQPSHRLLVARILWYKTKTSTKHKSLRLNLLQQLSNQSNSIHQQLAMRNVVPIIFLVLQRTNKTL